MGAASFDNQRRSLNQFVTTKCSNVEKILQWADTHTQEMWASHLGRKIARMATHFVTEITTSAVTANIFTVMATSPFFFSIHNGFISCTTSHTQCIYHCREVVCYSLSRMWTYPGQFVDSEDALSVFFKYLRTINIEHYTAIASVRVQEKLISSLQNVFTCWRPNDKRDNTPTGTRSWSYAPPPKLRSLQSIERPRTVVMIMMRWQVQQSAVVKQLDFNPETGCTSVIEHTHHVCVSTWTLLTRRG